MEVQDIILDSDYKYGFVTPVESDSFAPGLSEDTVRKLSQIKNEPEFLLSWRLKAFEKWLRFRSVSSHRLSIHQLLLSSKKTRET
jgi:Fe-S cluster assembly protein SufB